jgi:anti-sigma28 factor (negative regulator of flagellin synthesis)
MGSEGMPIPFNDKKVEEVRRAIQEGRFPVDAKKVADSLLTDTRDLIRTAPRSAQS